MRWVSAPKLFDPPDAATLEWLEIVTAAKWLRVAPWELIEQPAVWLEAVRMAREIEIEQMRNVMHKSSPNTKL
jgi:hypothetical protein